MKKKKNNVKISIIWSKTNKKTWILTDFKYIKIEKDWKVRKIELFKKQKEAFRKLQDNTTNEILYWGWARWWKTWIWVFWIVLNCILYKNSKYLIWRKQLSDLKVTTLLTLYEVLSLFWLWLVKQTNG